MKHIKTYLESKSEEQKAPLPEPWGVVYAHPNPDGSRKNCSNCFMWVKDENKCLIFDKELEVKGTMVCGYHVYGEPRTEWMDMGVDPLDPKTSGLEEVGEGTSCDTCIAYQINKNKKGTGNCIAVEVDGKPADVEAKGCCARWTKKQ